MNSPSRRFVFCLMASAVTTLALAFPVIAQTVTAPSVTKIVVPLPAGGGVDVFVRKLAEVMAKKMNATVIVDNKPGASGQIAVQAVASSPADGGTLLYLHSGILMAQTITGRTDILRDFKPVGKVSSSPHVLVVHASSPYKTTADLIKAIQASPDKLNFGTGGNGSPTHLMFEQLDDKVPGGLKATNIPFKGVAEGIVTLLAGNIDFLFTLPGTVSEHIKSGKLRALATTGKVRMPQLPDIPTLAEGGVTDYQDEPWGGLLVPAATPDAQVARLWTSLKASAADPEIVETIKKLGGKLEVSAASSEFSVQIRDELARNKLLVVKLGLKAE
ncbi:MAG: tripartite tricarboxylate transporter substrate binding protein [Rhodoferax sp.]|nr:tripartite tricarboxylate transporter substrate binding protein [Rhodoferax sp.]